MLARGELDLPVKVMIGADLASGSYSRPRRELQLPTRIHGLMEYYPSEVFLA